VSQAIRFPDEDHDAISIVVSRRDGRVVGKSSMADRLLGCGEEDEKEADDSTSERPCWSLMRRTPGAEGLPCTEDCVSERLSGGMPIVSSSIRLRGRSFDLRCEPVGDQVVTTLRPVPDPPLDPLSNHDQPLTPREVEVLRLLADGLDGSEIALALGISPGTVRTHVENMRDRLDCRTRAGLVAKGYRLHYLD
jgi:DNA-binding CsgD family transcriptional regulator